jgi:hypothetical protein
VEALVELVVGQPAQQAVGPHPMASRSSRWWITVDSQALSQQRSRSGSRSPTPATQAIRGSARRAPAASRIPLDGSTATTLASNQSAIATANSPVPAPRSSTGRPDAGGRYAATASRHG